MKQNATPLACALCMAPLVSAGAQAQSYPAKPIRIIVPFPPGGANDIAARTLNLRLPALLGQNPIIENRAGAGGSIGALAVATAPADGYTVLFANSGHAILGALNKNLTFDPIEDFAGVMLAGEAPSVIVVSPSLGVSNLRELVALAKSKPGQIYYGSAGIGTSTHIAGAYFALKAGIDVVHVPYTVSATIIADLLGERIQVSFVPLAFVLPLAIESYEPIGDQGWRQVLFGNVMAPTLLALLIFGAFAVFLTQTMAARALLAFGIGAALSAIGQAKGWPYHVLPALATAILLATFTLSQTVDRYLPISRSSHRLPVAIISATLMVLLYFQAALYTPPFYKQRQYEDSIGGILSHIVEQNAPHRTIMTLSPGIYPFWPMINYLNGRMTMRFLTMWVVQGVYADCEDFPALYNAPDTMGDTEKFVFDAVSDDFAKNQPDLLIVDTIPGMPRCQGKVFDYLEYFQQNKVFADAFENYEHLMDFDRYRIFRKKKKR